MDFLVFVSEIAGSVAVVIGACAWPLTALLLVLLLRKPLLDLAEGVKLARLKYRDWELIFREKVDRLETEAERADIPKPTDAKEKRQTRELFELADVSPRAAVLGAWLVVESALDRLAEDYGLRTDCPRTFIVSDALRKRGRISFEVFHILKELRHLRNIAAREKDFEVGTEEVFDYIRLAFRMADSLESLAAEEETPEDTQE